MIVCCNLIVKMPEPRIWAFSHGLMLECFVKSDLLAANTRYRAFLHLLALTENEGLSGLNVNSGIHLRLTLF